MPHPVPVTVFTGYLGAGKTSIIIGLVKQLPPDYRIVLLKNEFGDARVDSQIAAESQIAVKEMVNGCLCCVLVGRMEAAIDEIIASYSPDRIIIETSGSAYPAPIAVQLHRMGGKVRLDGIICVVDALNFPGYKDKSFTAREQLKYTDLILVNKHELVDERRLEAVMDDLFDMHLDTPKVKTDRGIVPPDLVFGLDSSFLAKLGPTLDQPAVPDHHVREVEVVEVRTSSTVAKDKVKALLAALTPEEAYRVKGVLIGPGGAEILNSVAGRVDWTPHPGYSGPTAIVFMGASAGDLVGRLPEALGIPREDVKLVQ
jgi:G3E family GTPase